MPSEQLERLAAADLQRSTKSPRLKETRFGVLLVVHRNGERVPTLIDHRTGLPPVLALRYALGRARRRGSHATLRAKLNRIAELYEWYDAEGVDFDAMVMGLNVPLLQDWTGALYVLDYGRGERIAGMVMPNAIPGVRTAPVRVPQMHNNRVHSWAAFGRWLARPGKWQTGDPRPLRRAQRAARDAFLDDINEWVEAEYAPIGTTAPRRGFTSLEMEVLLDCVQPDAAGRFPDDAFSPAVAERAWLIFGLAYYAGLRLGEILNLHVDDVPRRSEGIWEIRVERRFDDPEERRADAPRVKRRGRAPDIPMEFYEDLRRYVDRSRPKVSHPDLLVTVRGEPMSYWTGVAAGRQLREIAARRWAALGGAESVDDTPHTLGKFTWHRLRHTRARELLPRFVDPSNRQPGDEQPFLDHFGWARPSSAAPYIWELKHASASQRGVEALRTDSEPYRLRRML